MSPEILAVVAGVAIAYYVGTGVVHVAKKAGHAVAHVFRHKPPAPPHCLSEDGKPVAPCPAPDKTNE